MQLNIFERANAKMEIGDLFEAYYDCRKNKRNTANAQIFENDYEHNLISLCNEINNGTYKLGRSIAFIVEQPVKREIFAADFRDRIVHHWLINKLNPYFEKQFIYDSYSCRSGKGTHFGIQRTNSFIRKCSLNYTTDCFILKLDLKGFFMSIDKNILFKKLLNFINKNYTGSDKLLIIELCYKIIFYDATKSCIIKGSYNDWSDLPKDKSLFFANHIAACQSAILPAKYLQTFTWIVLTTL